MNLCNVTRTPGEILAMHRIPSGGRYSAYTTICPRCSHARRKQRDRCLSVLIDGRGVRWNCHHCQWKGWEFYDAHRAGEDGPFIPRIKTRSEIINDDEIRIKRPREIWKQSVNSIGTLAEEYLASRGLRLDSIANHVIRFHEACPWKDDETDRLIHIPAMIAAMRDIRGNELRAIQVTALRADASKIGRKMRGVAAGTVIKLSPDTQIEYGLTIGEGLETVLAGMKLGFRPAWACASASNLQAFPILAGIDALTILVDHDEAGLNATEVCRDRWVAANREVLCVIPPRSGKDVNDLIERAAQ